MEYGPNLAFWAQLGSSERTLLVSSGMVDDAVQTDTYGIAKLVNGSWAPLGGLLNTPIGTQQGPGMEPRGYTQTGGSLWIAGVLPIGEDQFRGPTMSFQGIAWNILPVLGNIGSVSTGFAIHIHNGASAPGLYAAATDGNASLWRLVQSQWEAFWGPDASTQIEDISTSGAYLVVAGEYNRLADTCARNISRFGPANPNPNGACNVADIAAPFGELDLNDYFAFLNAFSESCSIADIVFTSNECGVDLDDFFQFLSAFDAGC